jgi:thiol-disulfide isomerase/thioredoxin
LLFSAMAGTELAPDDVAWQFVQRDCPVSAMEHAAAHLHETPTDPGLHRVFSSIVPQTRDWERTQSVKDHYEALVEGGADDPGTRLGLAMMLARTSGLTPDCERIVELVDDTGLEGDARYHVLRAQERLEFRCEDLDPQARREGFRELAERGNARARVWDAVLAFRDDERPVTADEVVALVEEQPVHVGSFASAAWNDEKKKERKAHRRALLDLAERWATSDDLAEKTAAHTVFQTADDKRASQLKEALDSAVPCDAGSDERNALSDLTRAIYDADRRPTHALALEGLDAIEKKIPSDGPDRALWQRKRQARLEALGREDEVYAALKDRAAAVPDDGRVVNAWAYAASKRGVDLEAAEAAMAASIQEVLDAKPPAGSGIADWSTRTRNTLSSRYDTRGWLRYRLGRLDDAADDFDQALVYRADAVTLAHSGVVAFAREDERAFGMLKEAFLDGLEDADDEAALIEEAKAAFEKTWRGSVFFHPDGADGYLAMLEAARAEDEDESAGEDGAEDRFGTDHPVVGGEFPIASAARLDGPGEMGLEHDGILVVDVWATWCGPCVMGMPHLQDVASKYEDRGVRVVGLSVDDKAVTARKFFKGVTVDYDLAWVGKPGWEALEISGIPAMFVVDADGTVTDMIQGYGEGDTRLETALERLLDER